jgi:transposase
MEFPHNHLRSYVVQSTHTTNRKSVLALSLELCSGSWKIAVTDGLRARPGIFTYKAEGAAGRLEQLLQGIEQLKAKWQLPADCEVWVLYEAGQDGFWIERALRAKGVRVLVVDAASIPVARQARRAKTDRLDALLLLECLLGWLNGQRAQMQVVRVPEAHAEAQRQGSRDRGQLQKEIGQHRDRVRKLLRTVGCWQELEDDLRAQLPQLRCWDGQRLPEPLAERLAREAERLAFAESQLAALEKQLQRELPEPLQQRVAHLAKLKAVGWVGAMRLVLELYWRNFQNRRQVGSCVGLVTQPYDSGASRVDQGISKRGNRRVRSLLIEMAWMWLRYQPDSAIAKWFHERTAAQAANKRGKRIAIVAVARRLAIALWRYLETGELPQGARLKSA